MSNHAPKQARVVPLRPAAAPRVEPRVQPRVDPQGDPRAEPAAEPHGRPGAEPGPATVEPAVPARPAAREPLWRHVVGDVLRRERLDQRRTLREVAEEARISMPYLSEVERGRKEASSEVLAAAAHALGLRLADLLALAQHELTRAGTSAGGAARHARTPGRAEASLSSVTELAARRAGGTSRVAARPGEVRLAA
ncbi:helix-turn-helix domain-containing protein [Streptomyces sp. B6B3]|uniref:helix-turn-helix domain-containing protein n=1 Tax=Streptomyces sp. B6B3 TaxID=3153570 RepID=UPI00325F8294